MRISDNKIFQYSLAFLIPIILIMIACAVLGTYPFGDKAFLLWDSDIQFVPFLGYFKSLFSHGSDFVYSFSKAGGNGMFDFNACYINNPLNFIAFLFPNDRLDLAFQTIVFTKIALCGLSFSYLLNYGRKFDYRTLIFSTSYALSTCAIFYSQSIMGFEGMYMLPVALAGLEQIIKKQRCLLFILCTALTFLIEPYAGWVVLFFSMFAFIYFYFVELPQCENRKKIISLYFISIVFILALSCAITLPTWFSLQGTKYAVKFYPGNFNIGFQDILYSVFSGITTTRMFWGASYPYIYFGILPLILLFSYFINSQIERKQRLITAMFLVFITLTFSWHILFCLFNGGIPYPTGCIYRFAYIFIAIALYIAYKSINNIDFLNKNSFILLFLIYCFISGYSYFCSDVGLNKDIILFDFCFGSICICLLYFLRRTPKILFGIFSVLCFGELIFNTVVCYKLQDDCILSNPKEFKQNYDGISEIIREIKSKDNTFFRIDTEETFFRQKLWVTKHRHNAALLFNYPAITHYSSLGSIKLRNFYSSIGFDTNYSNNIISYNDNLPVFPVGFMGIKYILSSKVNHINPYKQIMVSEKTTKPIYVYENPYSFPISFVSENKILSLNTEKQKNVFETYNLLSKVITGEDFGDIFNIVEAENVEYSDDTTIAKIKIFPENKEYKKLWLMGNELGYHQFFFVAIDKEEQLNTNNTVNRVVEYLGEHKKGEEINVLGLRFSIRDNNIVRFYFASENIEILEKYFNLIKNNSCDLKVISSSHLKGNFKTTKNYQTLVLTIPYDDNWKIKIDNKEIHQQRILKGITGILIKDSGTHTIEMRYKVKGLTEGILISILTLIALLLFIKKNNSKKIF